MHILLKRVSICVFVAFWSNNHCQLLPQCDIISNVLNAVFVDVVGVWSVSDEEIADDIESSPPSMQQCSVSPSEEDRKMYAIVLWIKAFVFYLRRSYGLSDAVTSVLLKFLAVLFNVLGLVSHPSSVYMLQRSHSSKVNKFLRYVVCRKCDSVYKIDDCKEVWNASVTM